MIVFFLGYDSLEYDINMVYCNHDGYVGKLKVYCNMDGSLG
jgi:hypothetical protein